MEASPSALNREEMAKARALLARPLTMEATWPVLAAAAAFAVSSLLFVTAMVVAPSAEREPPARPGAVD